MSGSSQFIGRPSARTTERGYSTVFFYNIFVRQGADANQHALSLPYCPFIETNCDAARCVSLLAIPTRAAAFSPAAVYFEAHSVLLMSTLGNSIPRELCFNLMRLRLIVTSKLCTLTQGQRPTQWFEYFFKPNLVV
jgi:hypothetical protein